MSEKTAIDIDHVADLARIELSEEEKTMYLSQLGKVLDYFARLEELDVSDVEPSAHAAPVYNVWRQDEPGSTMNTADVVMNAPAKRGEQVLMPRVVSE